MINTSVRKKNKKRKTCMETQISIFTFIHKHLRDGRLSVAGRFSFLFFSSFLVLLLTMIEESSSWTLTAGAAGLLETFAACGLGEGFMPTMRLARTGGSLEPSPCGPPAGSWPGAAVSMGSP